MRVTRAQGFEVAVVCQLGVALSSLAKMGRFADRALNMRLIAAIHEGSCMGHERYT